MIMSKKKIFLPFKKMHQKKPDLGDESGLKGQKKVFMKKDKKGMIASGYVMKLRRYLPIRTQCGIQKLI